MVDNNDNLASYLLREDHKHYFADFLNGFANFWRANAKSAIYHSEATTPLVIDLCIFKHLSIAEKNVPEKGGRV